MDIYCKDCKTTIEIEPDKYFDIEYECCYLCGSDNIEEDIEDTIRVKEIDVVLLDSNKTSILLDKLMMALSPTTHALDLSYQSKFKEIISNNLDKSNTEIKRLLKLCWEER